VSYLCWVSLAVAQDTPLNLHVETERYGVKFLRQEKFGPQESQSRFLLSVTDKQTRKEAVLQVQNLTDKLERLEIVNDILIVFGLIESYGMDVVTLFDLPRGAERDSFLGYALNLSDSKRYLIYNQWHPRIAPAAAESSVILVYDLRRSPQENRVGPQEQGEIRDKVGHPIYPEENAQQQTYRSWIEAERDLHNVGPWGKYLWLDQDTQVVFLDRHDGENWLVVVDLSQGLDNVKIRRKVIDMAQILMAQPGDPSYETVLRERKERLTIKDLKYSDGRIIISVLPDIGYKTTQIEMKLP
jgi:hypothetical protein